VGSKFEELKRAQDLDRMVAQKFDEGWARNISR
jgi:hypothetical protein